MRVRSLWAGLAVLLALGAMAWILFGDAVFDEADTAHTETLVTDEGPSDAMAAEADGPVDRHPSLAVRERPTRDPNAGRGGVEVLAVNPAGIPLAGIRLELKAPPPVVSKSEGDGRAGEDSAAEEVGGEATAVQAAITAITDARGRAYFPDVPYDGTWQVVASEKGGVSGTVPHIGALMLVFQSYATLDKQGANAARKMSRVWAHLAVQHGSVAIKGPAARLELDVGVPLRFVGFDGATGVELEPAPWAATPQIGHAGKTKRRALSVQAVRARPGETSHIKLLAPDHAGLVPDRHHKFETWVSPLARELRAHFPQHPVAELMVSLPEGAQLRSGKDWKAAYAVDGRMKGKARASIDGFGRVSLRGVPFIAGQKVVVKGPVGKLGHLSARGVFGMDARDPLVLEGKWKPTPAARLAATRGAGKALLLARRADLVTRLDFLKSAQQELSLTVHKLAGGRLQVQIVGPADFEVGLGADSAKRSDKDLAYARVRVRRVGGAPAQAAEVVIGFLSKRLDARGRALIGPMVPGEYQVHVHGAGAVFHSTVSLVAGETTVLELDAVKGGQIDVLVVDGEGNALPFAAVTLAQPSGLAYADVEQDVQRIDPFVDHTGRRRFHAVEAGEVTVKARFGSRTTSIKVQVQAGGIVPARLVLVRPKPMQRPKPKPKTRAEERLLRELGEKLGRSLDDMKAFEEARERAKELRGGGK